MRVTLKKITVTTIISFVLYVFIMLSLFSCRTAKKTNFSENVITKETFEAFKNQLDQRFLNQSLESKRDVASSQKELLETLKSKQSFNENEAVKSVIEITAEPGKVKSASIGDTKVTSDGANVKVESTNTKNSSKEFESYFEKTEKWKDSMITEFKNLKSENNSLKSEIAVIQENQSSQTKTFWSEINKRGLTFGAILIGIVLLVVFLTYRYLRRNAIL